MRARGAVRLQFARHVGQPVEQPGRDPVGNRDENLPGDVEDRPVVDLQDALPLLEHGFLGQRAASPQGIQRPHAVDARQHRVERERVGNDRHRHPRGLLTVLLVQCLGDARVDLGAIKSGAA